MQNEPEWRKYEREIHAELVSKYPESTIRHDLRLPGSLSGSDRQIDVLIEEKLGGEVVATAVDAKYHSRRIDVKEVESFLGLLRDVHVNRGIMISPLGYTAAAMTRAFRDDVDLDLDVFSLDDFKQWQVAGAIPYAGRNAALLPAPLGWVVDAERHPGLLARLYRRGSTFIEAARLCEFMYVNLWDRRPPTDSLDKLLAQQEEDIRKKSPDAVITIRDIRGDFGWRRCIRRADIPKYPTAEITGFVEFPDAILFVVLFTPLVVERRNVRKLEYIVRKALPLSVRHAAQPAAAPDGREVEEH